jgi:formiminotetrahydrofolate cyclodeaminase
MKTKLTLTIEESIIERVKSYAKSSGKSLSELIENYLTTILDEKNEEKISPKLKKIIGSVKLPKLFDEEKELRNYYESKHL